MKRSRFWLIAFLFMLCGLGASAFEVKGINYEINSDGTSVTVVAGPNAYSGDIVIPSEIEYNSRNYSVTSINESAFFLCDNLKSVQIPNSVTSIGQWAFWNCSLLESVYIPKSVVSIGKEAFFQCSSLASLQVDTDNKIFDSRDNSNAIIESKTNTLLQGCLNTVIPNTVTAIGARAFSYFYDLKSMPIPNSVKTIGEKAFSECSSLAAIDIPSSVTSIGSDAFDGCISLKEIVVPYSVTSLGSCCFEMNGSLQSITFQNLNAVSSVSDCLHIETTDFKYYEYNISVSDPNVLTVNDVDVIQFKKPGVSKITIRGRDWDRKPLERECKIIVAGYPIKIGSSGYATFSAPSDYVVPKSLKAGIVEVHDNQANVRYLEHNTLGYPSEEALLLHGEPGEYYIETPLNPTSVEKQISNDLKPVYTNEVIKADPNNELFVLALGNKGLGFYYQKGCSDGSQVKNIAGKAYLDLSKELLANVKSLCLFDAAVLSIDNVKTGNSLPNSIYSLAGVKMNQSVDQLPQGIYIINGKRMFVK